MKLSKKIAEAIFFAQYETIKLMKNQQENLKLGNIKLKTIRLLCKRSSKHLNQMQSHNRLENGQPTDYHRP